MNWFKSFWKKPAPPVPTGAPSEPEPTFFTRAKQYLAATREYSDKFTPRAIQALALSQEEARRLNHNFVGTEHILLGLAALGEGVSAALLKSHGLDLQKARQKIESIVGFGTDQNLAGRIPYTPRVKKALALAMQEAKALNHHFIGMEHILLGLLSEGGGVAAHVLQKQKLDLQTARNEIMKDFGQVPPPASDAQKPPEQPQV